MGNGNQPQAISAVDVPECGNAPRRATIRDFVMSLCGKRIDELAHVLADEVRWEIVGVRTLEGIQDAAAWIAAGEDVREVRFASILTHGREGGVDGTVETSDGRSLAFCHVLRFANTAKTAKITGVRSYLVDDLRR